MAPYVRSMRASRAHSELVLLKAFCGAALAVVGYVGLTSGAIGPAYGSVDDFALPKQTASLTGTGDDLLITGSIGHLFGGSFKGTNKAEKQDRYRPLADVIEVAGTFDGIRARLAALRQPTDHLPATSAPVTTVSEPAAAPADPTIMVAALQPPVTTEALAAIDHMTADGAPLPMTQSEKLAYARADVPATVFDGSLFDKKGKKVSEKELNCLATAIYFEARGENYRGQVAVGQVVMNRTAHKLYPDTICGVVFQNQHKRNACQFSFACDGIPERVTEKKAWAQAEEIARGVVSGELYLTEVGYATHYHATYVYPHWAPRMKKVTKVGLHVFYQFKRGWKFG
jgi:spore germination cell wall hydrolase CwlJ-like protein